MKTLDCSTLEMLIENREPLDLIDIRPKDEFRAVHIPGARSVPFAQLARPKGFRRFRRTIESVYVISDDRATASLATGILRACGYVNAIVVEGGMDAWMSQGLPTSRSKTQIKLPNFLNAGSILLGLSAGLAVVLGKFLIAGLILVSATALFLKAMFVTRASTPDGSLTPAC
jgi:rhodanese-related sulfurtransferase